MQNTGEKAKTKRSAKVQAAEEGEPTKTKASSKDKATAQFLGWVPVKERIKVVWQRNPTICCIGSLAATQFVRGLEQGGDFGIQLWGWKQIFRA